MHIYFCMAYFYHAKFDRVRAGSPYRFESVMIDRLYPPYNVSQGDVVCVVNLRGCPKAKYDGTRARHAPRLHVRRSGLHQLTPMQREQVMEYMTREELVRLFKVAREHNTLHHMAMLVGLLHGLRVSEMLAIRGRDICDGKLSVKRLKKSRATLHALRVDSDPCSMSRRCSNWPGEPRYQIVPWSRQYMEYHETIFGPAGIHPSKRHYHVLKHSICVLLWQETHDLNAIQDHVGHRSSSSTLVYLRADAAQKAQTTIAEMSFADAL